MCPCIVLVLTVDSGLGCVDYKTLSDQTLIEMFIEGFGEETKREYQDEHGMYLDVCDWDCVECDDVNAVTKINFDGVASA